VIGASSRKDVSKAFRQVSRRQKAKAASLPASKPHVRQASRGQASREARQARVSVVCSDLPALPACLPSAYLPKACLPKAYLPTKSAGVSLASVAPLYLITYSASDTGRCNGQAAAQAGSGVFLRHGERR
jgi:hypothetical protein